MKRLSQHFVIFFLLFLVNTKIKAQVQIDSVEPFSITACGDQEEFQITLSNNTELPLSNPVVEMELPAGIFYVGSSLSESTNFSLAEGNISNLNKPSFTLADLPAGESAIFTIQAIATVEAVNYLLEGNLTRNKITIQFTGGSESIYSSNYNLLYAALNITAVSPTSKTLTSGNTFQRNITIVNAGYGKLSTFDLTDERNDTGIALIQANFGVVNANKDKITLSASDFQAIGNLDGFFDPGESITVIETLEASGCDNKTVTSTINTSWGCDSFMREGTQTYAHATINYKTPNIGVNITESLDACFGSGEASSQLVKLTNNGQGVAKSVVLDLFKSSEELFSAIDQNSIEYKIGNGAYQAITPAQTFATSTSSCLGAGATGRVVLNLPDIEAGENLQVRWNMRHCNINVCDGEAIQGWKYALDYVDVCENEQFSKAGTGQGTGNHNMTMFTESPTDIDNGEEETFTFIVSSHSNQLPEGTLAQYEVIFDIPMGLAFSGNASDLTFTSDRTTWAPSGFNFNATNNTVTAYYDLTAPFHIPKSEFNLKLVGNCSAASAGTKTISMAVNYLPDAFCAPANVIPFLCDQTINVDLHCPSPGPCEGMKFLSYDILRTSFGDADNDQNGLADNSGALDLGKIKRNRVMVGDTLQGVFRGVIGTSANHPSWNYGYASSSIELGKHLSSVGATAVVYDASSGTYITSNSVEVTEQTAGDDKTFFFNYSPVKLKNGNSAFTNFVFDDGDSVSLYTKYKVAGNIGGKVQEVKVTNSYYLSNVLSPVSSSDKYQCDYYNDRFTLIGYYFTTFSRNNYTVKTCNQTIQQDFALSIGDCCSNYEGGNLFPYEYRNWAHVTRAHVHIPDHYVLESSYVKFRRTASTNNSSTSTINPITPDESAGGYFTYYLDNYYESNGGNVPLPDDGFRGTLYLVVAPTCDVPNNTYQDIDWSFKFHQSGYIGAGETSWYHATPDRIRYTPTALDISSTNPVVDGLEKTVTWEVKVRNTSGNTDASHAWIHLKAPSGDLAILSVRDADTGIGLVSNSDYFEIGTLKRNKTKNIQITASYSACNVDRVWAYTGYECSGYPSSFSAFKCNYSQMELRVEPKPAELQSIISGTTVGDQCSRTIEVTTEVASVKLASADQVKVSIALPTNNSLGYVSGSSEMKYPLGDDFSVIADPVLNGGNLEYVINDINAAIASRALPGVLDLDSNKFQLRFQLDLENNFRTGDFVRVMVDGEEICGQPLPTINMSYDPSVKLAKNTISGLSNDATDNWSVSWADYNQDGFDDVFVSNYSDNKANQLYVNNTDGTFTAVTQAGALTSDISSTVASTWADYNNDGYIDVFLANNIGTPNALYQNNGDGSFSKASNNTLYTHGFYSHSASWADYDNDGYVDLFVAEYMPTKFNLLFKNNGDGTFSKVTSNPIVEEAAYSLGATWSDYNNDGYQDLFVPNGLNGANSLYKNEGGARFTKVSTGGIDTDQANSVGSSWGDYDNDGDQDLFVANASNQNNFLYNNNGDGTFTKVVDGIIVNDSGHSHGSSWGDIDNDGDLDLFVTNDQGTVNALYVNNGDGTFYKPDITINTDKANSFGTAMSDYDNDGDLDILVGNHSYEANDFYVNSQGSCNAWTCFNLTGTNSNRSAIGAKIRVKADLYGTPTWQLREISGQTGGGAGGQNSLKAMFGLADATRIDSVIVEWPSGTRQYLTNLTINDCVDIVEEEGYLVSGTAYHDSNQNCTRDEGEAVIAQKRIVISPSNHIVTTDQNGYYSAYVKAGSHTISLVPDEHWETQCSGAEVNHAVNVVGTPNEEYRDLDFPLVALDEKPDLEVTVGASVLRRGFRNTIHLSYQNKGAFEAQNAVLTLKVSTDIVIVGTDFPWTSRTDTTFTWDLGTMEIGARGFIILEDSVSLSATLGEDKVIQAIISCSNTETDYTNNEMTFTDQVVGAVDPNDKQVFPEGYGKEAIIPMDDTLTYKIRFQNVGNYPAYQVIVIDTLSTYLDISTLSDIQMSHAGSLSISDDGVLKFQFIDINLPDSVSNEPMSHGYVQFKVRPNVIGIASEAVITNKAYIQFDYNEYIVTNEVMNTMVGYKKDGFKLKCYPNPAKISTTIELYTNEIHLPMTVKEVALFTSSGNEVRRYYEEQVLDNALDLVGLPPGFYYMLVRDEYAQWYSGKFIIE